MTENTKVSEDSIQKLADELKQRRDEIKLKYNLGKAEARDRWEELEKEFQKVESQLKQTGEDIKESAHESRLKFKVFLKDLGEQYDKFRESLSD